MTNDYHPAKFHFPGWVACTSVQCVLQNPCQGAWCFLERVAGLKLKKSIEPPRSSVHCVEEEGEGFCEQQKWNQEIGPKVLNSHPRLLNCPECTLLPKVTFLFRFILFMARECWSTPGSAVSDHYDYGHGYYWADNCHIFLKCVQSEEPHNLISFVSNVRHKNQSLQWKCSGICIFFLFRCSRLKVFSDVKWIIEQLIWLNHTNLSIKLYWKAITVCIDFFHFFLKSTTWKLLYLIWGPVTSQTTT